MSEEHETERRALLEEHAALELEDKRVHGGSRDLAEHRALVARLREHSNRLHTFLERLRSRAEM